MVERYQSKTSAKQSTPPPAGKQKKKNKKPNGAAGDPLNSSPVTPELVEVGEALAAFSTEAAQLNSTLWERLGEAVWRATNGSEDGFALLNSWSQSWFYYSSNIPGGDGTSVLRPC